MLKLYNDPDSAGIEESHARHYYVEAVAGSTFQVKVDLTPEFNFYKMKPEHAVRIRVKIDGNPNSTSGIYPTKESLQRKFSKGETGGHTVTGPRHFCMEMGSWMRSEYSFGNLVLSMLGLSFSIEH